MQFLAAVVGACCVAGSTFAFAAWIAHADPPPATRTADEWVALLRAPNPGARAGAVRDLAELNAVPALPCDLLVAGLTDAAAVRIESVALLANVSAQGRCVGELAEVLQTTTDSHARFAAAQILGATGAIAARLAVPTLVHELTDPTLQDAAAVALGRMTDTSAGVQRALARAGETARGETLGDVLAALVALRATGKLLRPLVDRALVDSLTNVRVAALVDLELITATLPQRAVATRTAIGMLHDPEATVRETAARFIGCINPGDPAATAALRAALEDPRNRVREAAREALHLCSR
jgi:HEAT repeat protein